MPTKKKYSQAARVQGILRTLGSEPSELLNFSGKEPRALSEGRQECLELWNLIKDKKRGQVKKVYEVAKIVLS